MKYPSLLFSFVLFVFQFMIPLASQANASETLQDKLKEGQTLIKLMEIKPNEIGTIEFSAKSAVLAGFYFSFPHAKIEGYKGSYVLEMKDKNGYASVSTGPVDNGVATRFESRKGKIKFEYKNNTGESYPVLFWKKAL